MGGDCFWDSISSSSLFYELGIIAYWFLFVHNMWYVFDINFVQKIPPLQLTVRVVVAPIQKYHDSLSL